MKRPAPWRLQPRIKGSIRQPAIGAVALSLVLAGCQVPLPGSGRQGIPSPFPSTPSSGVPQPLPSPSLPAPASLPAPPSLPSPASLPSPSSDPSPPAASPPSGGGAADGSPSVLPPSGGGPQQGGGDATDTASEDGQTVAPGGPNTGWEVSNVGAETSGESGADDTPGESGSTNEAGDPRVDALERALGELDGEILDERIGTTAASAPGQARGGGGTERSTVPAPPRAEPDIARAPTPIPPDRPDARDDDVVARQIREAAMAATDPKLREALWEEYRRYKDGR